MDVNLPTVADGIPSSAAQICANCAAVPLTPEQQQALIILSVFAIIVLAVIGFGTMVAREIREAHKGPDGFY